MSFTTLEEIKIRLDEYDVTTDTSGNTELVFKTTPKLDYKINVLIDKARKDIAHNRRYPESYSDTDIQADIDKNYQQIVIDLVLYDYSKEGGEYEETHNENGINRKFIKRESILGNVIPFCRVY